MKVNDSSLSRLVCTIELWAKDCLKTHKGAWQVSTLCPSLGSFQFSNERDLSSSWWLKTLVNIIAGYIKGKKANNPSSAFILWAIFLSFLNHEILIVWNSYIKLLLGPKESAEGKIKVCCPRALGLGRDYFVSCHILLNHDSIV